MLMPKVLALLPTLESGQILFVHLWAARQLLRVCSRL